MENERVVTEDTRFGSYSVNSSLERPQSGVTLSLDSFPILTETPVSLFIGCVFHGSRSK